MICVVFRGREELLVLGWGNPLLDPAAATVQLFAVNVAVFLDEFSQPCHYLVTVAVTFSKPITITSASASDLLPVPFVSLLGSVFRDLTVFLQRSR